jgi:hypothetical protein
VYSKGLKKGALGPCDAPCDAVLDPAQHSLAGFRSSAHVPRLSSGFFPRSTPLVKQLAPGGRRTSRDLGRTSDGRPRPRRRRAHARTRARAASARPSAP